MPRNQGTSRKGKPKKTERAAGMGRALERSQRRRYRPKANGSSSGVGGMAASGAETIGVVEEETSGLKSVLEMDNLTDFLGQAQMAGREFASEKERFVVLDPLGAVARDPAVRWSDEDRPSSFAFAELSVPRRPAWDADTTPEELARRENDAFLEWRRGVAQREEALLEASAPAVATPFEKNLEVWRQLWRVLERSSCVLQIVDARNPLFYFSEDLRTYAEDESGKPTLLLVNKSDFLTKRQRERWRDHFTEKKVEHVFFSAHEQQRLLDGEGGAGDVRETASSGTGVEHDEQDSTRSLNRAELLDFVRRFAERRGAVSVDRPLEFATVGFPNVGKSSLINVLIGARKNDHSSARVGVAARPGKTKHFQTIRLKDDDDDSSSTTLCDCPGLVFPSFVSSAADLVAAGVYPLHQMREPQAREVVRLICERLPASLLEAMYGLDLSSDASLRTSLERERSALERRASPSRTTVDRLLDAFCLARKMFHASSGTPDHYRAARVVISDYVSGALLYCHAPPGADRDEFERETIRLLVDRTERVRRRLEARDATALADGTEQTQEQEETELHHDDAASPATDVLDLLEELDLAEAANEDEGGRRNRDRSASNKTNDHKKHHNRPATKKWGKKGRKFRDDDPYGCHSDPDPLLAAAGGAVASGKYGGGGYTRSNYAGTNGAVPFRTARVLRTTKGA